MISNIMMGDITETITMRSVKGVDNLYRVGNGKPDAFGEMNGYYIRTDGRKAS